MLCSDDRDTLPVEAAATAGQANDSGIVDYADDEWEWVHGLSVFRLHSPPEIWKRIFITSKLPSVCDVNMDGANIACVIPSGRHSFFVSHLRSGEPRFK